MSEEIYGMVASFKDTPSLYYAAEKVRDAGSRHWDTYSSFPVHGMPEAQGQAQRHGAGTRAAPAPRRWPGADGTAVCLMGVAEDSSATRSSAAARRPVVPQASL